MVVGTAGTVRAILGSHIILKMTLGKRNAGRLFRPTGIRKSMIVIETLLEPLAEISMEFHHVTGRNRREPLTVTNIHHRNMLVIVRKRDEINPFGITIELVSKPGNPAGLSMLETVQAFSTAHDLRPAVRQTNAKWVKTSAH